MFMNLYVVYDKVAGESGPVFEAKNHGTAARNYRREMEKLPTSAAEYMLLHVGSIDHDTSLIKPLDQPEDVTHLGDVKIE